MEIKINTKDLEKKLSKLSTFPKYARKAAANSINRTLTFGNKRVKQITRNNYNIKSGDIQKTIKLRKANTSDLTASITSNGKRLTLSRFSRSASSWKRGRKINVKVKKGSNKKVNTSPKAFVTNVKGNTHIAKRVGKTRFPIEVLHTISVPQMISNSKVSEPVNKEIGDYLEKRCKHEIEYQIGKLVKNGG